MTGSIPVGGTKFNRIKRDEAVEEAGQVAVPHLRGSARREPQGARDGVQEQKQALLGHRTHLNLTSWLK